MNEIILEDMKHLESKDIDWSVFKGCTFLITGAYGMLASYLVWFLIYLNEVNPQYNITIFAQGRNASKMHARFGEYVDKTYFHYIQIDVCQEFWISERVDYIIHAASLASPQYYSVNPVGTLMPNVFGTYHLLELARKKQVKKVLFFSSGDVYGKLPENICTITEKTYGAIEPMSVRSCYGESKRMGETMCKAWEHQYGVKTNSVRIFHTYGPTLDLKNDRRLFAEFVSNIVHRQNLIMKSDGSAIRAFCYLGDALEAFLRILLSGVPGEAYNMCNSEAVISVKQLANLLVEMFPERNLHVIRQDRHSTDAYIESPVKIIKNVDTKKLQALGWKPETDIPKGFKRTVLSFEQGETT